MFHVHSSCIPNIKNINGKYLNKESVSSKYRNEPEIKKRNVNVLD